MPFMLTAYILGSLALIVKPGPDVMCTLATALSEGRARACVLMCGLILGCWFWIMLLALGVGAIFTAHPMVFKAVQIVGVGYIGYLAYGAIKDAIVCLRGTTADVLTPATARGWALVGRGVAMSMSNPLTILFFLAFFPHFTHDAELPPFVMTLALGAVFCALVPVVYVPVILVADVFREKMANSPVFSGCLKLVSGLLLVAVVVILVLGVCRATGAHVSCRSRGQPPCGDQGPVANLVLTWGLCI